MRLDIRTRNLDLTLDERTQLLAHAERRLRFGLSRFADRLARVTARLEDVNGPRGGVDKRVTVTVLLHPRGEVRVEETDAALEVAVDRAADRAGAAVARELARQRPVGVAL